MIPEWAIGVGVVMLFVTAAQVVRRLVLPPQEPRVSGLRARLMGERDRGGLDEIEARLAELETLKQRVVELEERVDFTERMLTSKREAQRLAPPQK